MSWSTTPIVGSAEEISTLIDGLTVNGVENPSEQVLDGLNAGKDAAKTLIASGAFGDPKEYPFSVTLSGHANLEHKPAQGWANDCISISISQSTEQYLNEYQAKQKAAE